MDNIYKIFDNLELAGSMPGVGGALGAGAANPLVGALGAGGMNPLGAAFGLGANDPLAAGAGLLGAGMMSGGSSSGGNPAQASGQTPDYSSVDAGMMPIGDATGEFTGLSPSNASVSPLSGSDGFSGDVIMNLPGSDGSTQDKEEFNYQKMLESIAAGTESLAESSEPTSMPSMGVSRGMAPQGQAPVMYGNMTGASPGMQAIKNNQPMIGGQPSIEQILQSLAR